MTIAVKTCEGWGRGLKESKTIARCDVHVFLWFHDFDTKLFSVRGKELFLCLTAAMKQAKGFPYGFSAP
ncbi:MAG: hypothetical protein J6Z82_09885 [Schwartzia sp.]|nr:hypothetical protein [Schwartzia sp. (in: firmicutes)]